MMDAAPITLGQEFSGYSCQIDGGLKQLEHAKKELYALAIGGTAVGTGLNTKNGWQDTIIKHLRSQTNLPVTSADNKFMALSTHNALLSVSSALRQIAADFLTIGNNIRMLASGPRAGLAEIILPANEPGSSIMPGKVNPTQIESLTMIAVEVMGNDTTVAMACSQGHLQLNLFQLYCVKGLECNHAQVSSNLERSLMIVTALTPRLGYDKAAEIAKYAQEHDLTIREVLVKKKIIFGEEFDELIKKHVLTH